MKNPSEFEVTVLMPVYNAEKYLSEAIESILNQTFTRFEFLIINDGSTDNSEKIIRKYNDPRIKYIRNEKNIQLISTLNKGIRLAKGKYIIRMDADDISVKNRIEKQVAYMEKHPEVGVCGSFIQVFGENVKSYISKRPEKDMNIRASLLTRNALGHPNVIIRKSVIISNDIFYNISHYRMEDWGLWVSLMPVCKFHNIQEVLLYYRYVQTSESRQNKKDEKHLNISSEITQKFFTQLGISCNTNESRKITSIIKSPYVYKLSKQETYSAYCTLSDKLNKAEIKIEGIKSTTIKNIIPFTLRNYPFMRILIKDIGLFKYLNNILNTIILNKR